MSSNRYSKAIRQSAIDMVASGLTRKEVAKQLGCSGDTVSTWCEFGVDGAPRKQSLSCHIDPITRRRVRIDVQPSLTGSEALECLAAATMADQRSRIKAIEADDSIPNFVFSPLSRASLPSGERGTRLNPTVLDRGYIKAGEPLYIVNSYD